MALHGAPPSYPYVEAAPRGRPALYTYWPSLSESAQFQWGITAVPACQVLLFVEISFFFFFFSTLILLQVMAIVAGFGQASVTRLNPLWEELPNIKVPIAYCKNC